MNKFFPRFLLVVFLVLVLMPMAVSAAELTKPKLSVQLGDTVFPFETVSCEPGKDCQIGWIGQYVGALYRYGVGLAAILAVVMIMVGGFLWLTSGGNQNQVSRAKEFIVSALTGLLLALFSFMILYTVNPRLVQLESIRVKSSKVSGGGSTRVEPETLPSLSQISGHELLRGSDDNLILFAERLFSSLSNSGNLPQGIIISSGYRPGSETVSGSVSQHALGRAFDVWWPGINSENAQAFAQSVRDFNYGVTVISEVTSQEQDRYGATGPNVHIDIRNIY